MTQEALLREEERIDDLFSGGLRIIQHPARPRFSVDAVLLAHFIDVAKGERLLDLGTGSGVLPLLLSRKQTDASFCGLELMPEMAEMAGRSVQLNNLCDRISIQQGDIRDAASQYGKASFDVVVSNPPYFFVGAGRENTREIFAAARSERYCTLALLLDSMASLLRPLGRVYLVYLAERISELVAGCEMRGLHVETLRQVQPYADTPANLLLLAARKGGKGGTKILPPLVIYASPGVYSQEMEKIYGRDTLSGGNADR